MAWAKLEEHASGTEFTFDPTNMTKFMDSMRNKGAPVTVNSELEEMHALLNRNSPTPVPHVSVPIGLSAAVPAPKAEIGDLVALEASMKVPSEKSASAK